MTNLAILVAEAGRSGDSWSLQRCGKRRRPAKGRGVAASRPFGRRSDEGHGDVARILRLAFVRPQSAPGAERALRTLTCTKTNALLQIGRRAPLRKCLARADLFSVGEWLVAGVLAPALACQRPRHQPKRSAPAPNNMNSHDRFSPEYSGVATTTSRDKDRSLFRGAPRKPVGTYRPRRSAGAGRESAAFRATKLLSMPEAERRLSRDI